MACLVFMLLILTMAGYTSASWCVCKDIDVTILQTTLDYACGQGADCNQTHQNGPCFQPNTVRAHCSYAVNSYFQKNRQQLPACNFSGSATIVTSDPSNQGCAYPTTASSTPTTPLTPPGTGTGTPSTMPNGSPLVTTPSTGGSGILGGTNPGTLGPSGINTDMSDGGVRLPTSILLYSSIILTFSALVFW